MCGIAGFFGRKNTAVLQKSLTTMLAKISHRGPDGHGTILFDQAGLGHVRLAIIDIAGGTQPMATDNGQLHISFNGEIYNFEEIKQGLINIGYHFRTASDTEVVLQAYKQYGTAAFNMFRGMFAIAIWDEAKKEGFLVRDRFGVKPLFYSVVKKTVIFASEIKAIIPALSSVPDLNLNSLHLLMNFRYVPGVATMFEKVSHLPPGHYLHWHEDEIEVCKWTKPIENNITDFQTTVELIRVQLKQAVRRQLISDVPLGGYLSGGIDSATLVKIAAEETRASHRKFPTFTIQTGDSPLEGANARESARFIGVENTQKSMSMTLQAKLPWLLWHLEVPKVNAVQSAMVANLASHHVKVALSGVGADEFFLGYNIYRILGRLIKHSGNPSQKLVNICGTLSSTVLQHLGLRFEELQRGGQMLASLPDLSRMYGILRNVWDSPEARKRIYGPRLLAHASENVFERLQESWPVGNDALASIAKYEIKNKMVNDLLLQEDRLSMAFGLEVRVPFLDEDLASLLAEIPSSWKIPGHNLKKMMRDVVSNLLPAKILQRPKSGFQVPIHQFFNDSLRELSKTYLSKKRLLADGLFNPTFVETVLAARPHYRLRWHYFLLYLMIGTNIWIDVFQHGQEVEEWQ